MQEVIRKTIVHLLERHQPGWYLHKAELLADLYRALRDALPACTLYREYLTEGLQDRADLALLQNGHSLLIELCYAPRSGHPALLPATVMNPLTRRQIIDNIETALMYIERYGQEAVLALSIDENTDSFRDNTRDLELLVSRGLRVEQEYLEAGGVGVLFAWCSKIN